MAEGKVTTEPSFRAELARQRSGNSIQRSGGRESKLGATPSSTAAYHNYIKQMTSAAASSSGVHSEWEDSRKFKMAWDESIHTPPGMLECVASGYTSHADYVEIGETLKKICDQLTSMNGVAGSSRRESNATTTVSARDGALACFLRFAAEYMPHLHSLVKVAPSSMRIECVMYNAAGFPRDAFDVCISQSVLEDMCARLDDVFHEPMTESVARMRGCFDVLPLSIISIKKNYFSVSEAILAPYTARLAENCRNVEFFVPFKERVRMLRYGASFHSTEEMRLSIQSISSLVSDMLSCLSLRVILHVARRLRGVQEQKEGARVQSSRKSPLLGLEERVAELCVEYENLVEGFNNCRRLYPHVFALDAYLVQWSKSESRPPTLAIMTNILLKLLFLFAGGTRSIAADDRQPPEQLGESLWSHSSSVDHESRYASRRHTGFQNARNILTDDVALASDLRVQSIGWTTIIIKLFTTYWEVQDKKVSSETAADAQLCANVLKIVYQYMGVLPFGAFCPSSMLKWIDIFPLYTLGEEEMRTMLKLYCRIAERETHVLRSIDRTDIFRSLTCAMQNIEECLGKRPKTRIVSDFIVPVFTDEPTQEYSELERRRHCGVLYDLFASECMSAAKPLIDITGCVKLQLKERLLKEVSPALLLRVKASLSAASMQSNANKVGTILRWKSVSAARELQEGDVLEVQILLMTKNKSHKNIALNHFSRRCESGVSFTGQMDPQLQKVQTCPLAKVVAAAGDSRSNEGVTTSKLDFRWTIAWVHRIQPNEYMVIFDAEEKIPSRHVVTSVKLVTLTVPLFLAHGPKGFSWTNPKYSRNLENSLSRVIPFMLGWFLGSSVANDVYLQIPISPLVLRMVARALNFNEQIKDWHPQPADLLLISQEFYAKLGDLEKGNTRDIFDHFVRSERRANPSRMVAAIVRRACFSLIMNLNDDVETSFIFWEAVVRGVQCTPLGQSPLLSRCCARVARSVLCGQSMGEEYASKDFFWENHFVFVCDAELSQQPYAEGLRDAVVGCLNENFIGERARSMLMFLTGRPLLPPTPLTECITLSFGPREGSSSQNTVLQMMPVLWPKHHVLCISQRMELLLVHPHGASDKGAAEPAKTWLDLSPSQQSARLVSFGNEMSRQLHAAVDAVVKDGDISSMQSLGMRSHVARPHRGQFAPLPDIVDTGSAGCESTGTNETLSIERTANSKSPLLKNVSSPAASTLSNTPCVGVSSVEDTSGEDNVSLPIVGEIMRHDSGIPIVIVSKPPRFVLPRLV
ncbi:hypothetical protein DQ04_03121030 [Trypanosoma grayi]|uniref:hypothetical protein n=1 Tax=Trypanosoma grayi TaxID=71804 RepID=UPI0004F4109D|nr:hypothetical protein DQ04_03121030 [Trypanosoma grayi]KEG10951.1 hypothetical protein DQ04_03121030 [Trypanosoma grayi]